MAVDAGTPHPPGLVASLARLSRTLLSALRTRLEIIATEIEEERIRFAQLALWVAMIAFFLGLGVLMVVLFVVILLWDTHRLATVGAFAVLFLGGGIAGALVLRHRMRTRPKMFASTIGELIKDEERLGSGE